MELSDEKPLSTISTQEISIIHRYQKRLQKTGL